MVTVRLFRSLFVATFCLLSLVVAKPLAGISAEQAPPTQLPSHSALLMGTDWYPEQWPETPCRSSSRQGL